MTRKVLGIDRDRTTNWLIEVKNCPTCGGLAAETMLHVNKWQSLQAHIWADHADQELCVTCIQWFDDVDFAAHLMDRHHATWEAIKPTEG